MAKKSSGKNHKEETQSKSSVESDILGADIADFLSDTDFTDGAVVSNNNGTRTKSEQKNSLSEQKKVLSPEEYEKRIYDLQQLLEISRSLCTTLEINNLIESILYISMAQMRVLASGVFVHEGFDSDFYSLGSSYSGLELNENYDYKISASSNFIQFLMLPENSNRTYTPSELKEAIPENDDMEMLLSLNPSLIVPLVVKNRINGILLLGERILGDAEPYTEYERNEIYTIASLASVAISNASLIEQSSTDSMTHLKQKYYFFNILSDRLDFAQNHTQTVSVIMFDIDFFKKFNDTYGHSCGDYVLKTVAKIMKSCIRDEDLASRYGGEEFTVMLNNASRVDSMAIAERIRTAIESYDFEYKQQHMKVTISGGVSIFSQDNNPITSTKALVDQADQALYISKRTGRNKITFADPALIAALDESDKS